ncbi:MAG: alpha-amylase family protein, partial [Pseudomonadota bacterium]
ALFQAAVAEMDPAASGDVFVQLFEWRWDDVAEECERVLGPAGIRAVQVSPPNEHIDHHALPEPYQDAWWARYQPVSYRLDSRSGSEKAFREMVERCANSGVEVYADAVLNHMANNGQTGVAGSTFDRKARRYEDYADAQFHEFCVIDGEDYWLRDEPSDAVAKERARRVRDCQLGELPDLATEREDVRATLRAYLNNLLATGVKGLRVDAAKHMQSADIAAIVADLDQPTYLFQEVIDTRGQSVNVEEYLPNGAITEFLYSLRIGEAFAQEKLSALQSLTQAGGLLPSSAAVVFVDNHDNQRGHGMAASTTHRDGARYQLATTFMLAWPYGYPRLMSSYEWGGVDDHRGPPADNSGATLPIYRADGSSDCGAGRWICEHRSAETLRMVDFRRRAHAVDATTVANWWDNGSTAVAFSLRSPEAAFAQVVINSSMQALEAQVSTSLPDGGYCALGDVETPCKKHEVRDGELAISLAPESSLVLERSRATP